MKKRFFAFLVTLTVLFGVMSVTMVNAANYVYNTIDITGYATSKAYIEGTADDAEYIHDYFMYGGSADAQVALDKSSVQSKLTSGVLSDGRGVPYSMPLNKAITVQANSESFTSVPKTTVDLTNAPYEKIYYLAGIADFGSEANYQEFYVTINYTDGTRTQLKSGTDASVTLLKSNSSTTVEQYACTVDAKIKWPGQTSFNFNSTFNLYSYEITPVAGKIVDSVDFESKHWWTSPKVMAITTAALPEEMVLSNISTLIQALPTGTDITIDNKTKIQAKVNNINALMSVYGITVNDLSAADSQKIAAVQDRLNKMDVIYNTIDITGYATSKAYIEGTADDAENIHDYFMFGGTPDAQVALVKSSVQSKLTSGVLSDGRGVPYSMPLNKAITVQANSESFTSVPKTTVDLTNAQYERIYYLAGVADFGAEDNYQEFYVTINYTDGTYTQLKSGTDASVTLLKRDSSTTVEQYACTVDASFKWPGQTSFGMGATFNLYSYGITPAAGKIVDSLDFESKHWWTSPKVLAITTATLTNTAIMSEISELIRELPEAGAVTIDNKSDVTTEVEVIEAMLSANNIAKADLSEADSLKLTAVQEKLKKIMISYNTIDLTNYATSKVYIEGTADDAENIHDYFMYGGSPDAQVALVKSSVQSKLTSGILSDGRGVPYSMPLNKAITVQANSESFTSVPKTTVDLTNAPYEKIYYLAGVADFGAEDNYQEFYVTINYTDGTYTQLKSGTDASVTLLKRDSSTTVEQYACTVDAQIKWPGQTSFNSNATFNLYSYGITPAAEKIVDSVDFESKHWWTSPKILAVTTATELLKNDIEASNIKLMSGDTEVTSLISGDMVYASADIEFNALTKKNAELIFAVYSTDGRLLCMKSLDIELNPGDLPKTYETGTVELPEKAAGGTAKIFLWDSFIGAKPLSNITIIGNATGTELYLSPTGNDGNSGSINNPLRTLQAVVDVINTNYTNKTGADDKVTVFFREGDYYINDAITITGNGFLGKKESPVVFMSYPGETATFIGGGKIDISSAATVTDQTALNRLPQTAVPQVKQINLAAQGISGLDAIHKITFATDTSADAQLIYNDNLLARSRWPNTGYAAVGTVIDAGRVNPSGGMTFTSGSANLGKWVTADNGWVKGYWGNGWSVDSLKIKTVDAINGYISTSVSSTYEVKTGQKFFAYNLLEEMDAPGEWYVDSSTNNLYLYPPAGFSTDGTMIATSLNEPIITLLNTSNVEIKDVAFIGGRDKAIYINGGSSNKIESCSISKFGKYGVEIENSYRSGVKSCEIFEMGAGGIKINAGDRNTLSAGNCYAENNRIHDFEQTFNTYQGAVVLGGVGNKAVNNKIFNAPHLAIQFYGNDHLIEYNELYNLLNETKDAGAIYCLRDWAGRGNVIRYNYLHDITGEETNGIYLDDMFSGANVYGNIMYNVSRGIQVGGGRSNVVTNNIIALSDNSAKSSIYADARGLEWSSVGNEIYSNLAKVPYTSEAWSKYTNMVNLMEDEPLAPKYNVIMNNVLYKHKSMSITPNFLGYSNVNNNIAVSNSEIFTDESNMNLTLSENSIVYNLLPGFKPIPFQNIGLYKNVKTKFR